MKAVLALALITLSSTAYAEVFSCEGTGKFKGVSTEPVEVNWPGDKSKPVLEQPGLKVEIYADKADTDGPHYLGIHVIETQGKPATTTIHSAKGSIREMVMYTEGSSDGSNSLVACIIN